MFQHRVHALAFGLLTLTGALAACDDGDGPQMTPSDADPMRSDGGADATGDMASDAMPDPISDMASDAMPEADAIPPDAAPPRCSAPPPGPMRPDGPLPPAASPHRGIDSLEAEAWQTLSAGLLADPGVHFVATFDHGLDAFVIEGGPIDARARIAVRRIDAADRSELEIVEGAVESIFPRTEPTLHGDYGPLLDALANPDGVIIADRGYAEDDPRVGWLALEDQSWPDPLVRLTTVFAAADAPDAIVGTWPWANGGTGSHGSLGLLQSRAVFVLSGAGARRGVVIDTPARLVDAAPTALAALGLPTTGGVGPDGTYADGLYLLRQDGEVRWEALDPDPCARADHVVMVLFDGLLATELNHLMLSDDPPVELPTLRALGRDGAVYRHGAVVGFPSYSAPGHTTAGTGAWPGHHGVLGNDYYGRADGEVVNPFAALSELPSFFAEPARLYALLDRMLTGDVETVSEAVHRGLGADAFTAVFNELTIRGSDYDPLHHFGIAPKAGLDDTTRIDALGQNMVQTLLGDGRRPVPVLLQIAFGATDSAGEQAGPHSELLRETLQTIDERMAVIRDAYDRRGVLDRTLFVLVSDHGMELVDPTRRASVSGAIRDSGVKTRHVGTGGIWLATLQIDAEESADGLRVTVTAHDSGQPVAEVEVRCEGCRGLDPEDAPVFATDAEGVALLPGTILAAGDVITARHPAFNAQRLAPLP